EGLMNNWRRLGIAGLVAGAFTLSGAHAWAAGCIDTSDNTVDDATKCLLGTGGDTGTCRAAIAVDNFDGLGNPPADPKKIVCKDGDVCDADGSVNGSCTFLVGACLNLPGCTADTVTAGVVTAPKQKDVDDAIKKPAAANNRNALQRA